MRLSIEQTDLKLSIAHAASIIERRNAIPILAHVHLSARDGALYLTATDLDIELVQRLPAQIETEGACTVSGDILKRIASKLPGASVIELTLEDGTLTVASGRSSYDLHTLDASDYPAIASDDFAATLILPASDLARAIGKTSFAMSTEETRYYLNGLYMHNDDSGRIAISGTDGHRLSRHILDTPPSPDMPGVIIPRKTVSVLSKLLDAAGDDQIIVKVSDQKVRATIGQATLTSKVIDGQFPDYRRVIPETSATPDTLRVDATDLKSAIDRVMIVSDERASSVILDISEDQITARVPQATEGRSEELIACSWNSPDMRMGFNSRNLLSAVTAMESESAELHLGSPVDAARIEDGSTTMVIMPMRV